MLCEIFRPEAFLDIKACVRYFLFFHQMMTLGKFRKMRFISSKKLFLFPKYSNFCNFFPSFPSLSRFKRKNESGIIYDTMKP